jgi:hypothetical protein
VIERPEEYYIMRYRDFEAISYKPYISAKEQAFDALLQLEEEADQVYLASNKERRKWLTYSYPSWAARVAQIILNHMAQPDVWVTRFMNLSTFAKQREFIYNLIAPLQNSENSSII